jgi:hypothetical protein
VFVEHFNRGLTRGRREIVTRVEHVTLLTAQIYKCTVTLQDVPRAGPCQL